ncbi:caspase-1-like isoform X1 [Leptotrombidium deliense]|uniref:Caspase-1-like isoform X1 n=1 Tax=Leptotrombidium deliense TaxID=299467 RepID=A0A443SBA1_9ACAR|nr:caspase-1-like isoform X1 [Leptotrombidium deliense]
MAPAHVKPEYKFENGLCLIFNHKLYHPKFGNGLREREGTEADVRALTDYFKESGFTVKDFHDQTVKEIKQLLNDYAQNKYKLKCDILVTVVLTHGGEDKLYAYDDPYNLDVLYKPFLPQNCELLKNKPKVFLISACQGKKRDKGISYDFSKVPLNAPTDDDYLVIMSAVPGFEAFRHNHQGTFAKAENLD